MSPQWLRLELWSLPTPNSRVASGAVPPRFAFAAAVSPTILVVVFAAACGARSIAVGAVVVAAALTFVGSVGTATVDSDC